ncbi:L-fuculose-phosphate aldolase [Pseudoramibacter alactolyticus]|uniref:L-fuculose-phosphate aldolase n=1 Tax=Pseudoramibacter alactolyticus TaxID=113287 RepID=UPI0028F0B658|nr:L-fuculose-phosphate aldolase [Pseudoramibacter alactolyticus]
MLLEKERIDVVEYCKKLITSGLTTGTGGNISILNREKQLYAISPSGIDSFDTKPEDVVVIDLEGNIVDGKRKPSSEHVMHRIFYTDRNDINAVVHTHSTFATVLGTLNEGLPASSYLVAFAGKDVRCGKYASYGTPELAKYTFDAMKDRYAAIMANHGLIAGGEDINEAFNVANQIEQCCKVYVLARAIGKPVILPEAEMERMIDKFHNVYGQK